MIKNPSPIDRICPAPLLPVGAPAPRAPPSRRNVAVVSHDQYVLTVTAAPASRVKTELSKAALVTLTFDLESGVRVTCDAGDFCANSGLPRPLCSRVRPDVRDRQTSDVRQKHRLMPPSIIVCLFVWGFTALSAQIGYIAP